MKNSMFIFLFTLSLVMLLIFSLCSSYEYKGKDILAIEYIKVNYNGGYTKVTKIELVNCQVLSKEYLPTDEVIDEFSIDNNFQEDSIDLFLNQIGEAGIFDLKAHYQSPGGIIDGGGWTLTIYYADGTSKISAGENNYPVTVFKKADYAFYNLYGDDLFGTIPSSYMNPPSIDIAFIYSIDNNHYSQGYSGLSAINYNWNKSIVDNVDVIEYANQHQIHEFDSSYDYKFVLWTANYEYKFSKMIITSYDLSGNNEKEIESSGWFKQKEYNLEFNRVYVIKITFAYGTCEFVFSTITT
ncbi:MAG: hypothetical protein Q7I99_04560 [Acholeplasmataceae bacterium]|nr:hypothetical protein [Acholeplasmataceae bacterium]